jgi:hypothetical protein
MKLLPDRSTRSLLRILGYYSTILYAVLLLAHAILRSQFTGRSIFGLASLAFVSALVAGLGFWLEGRLFFMVFSSSLIAGTLYILYVVITNATPGWGELTSLVGFMLICASGIIVGLAAEFVRYLIKPKLRQTDRKPV